MQLEKCENACAGANPVASASALFCVVFCLFAIHPATVRRQAHSLTLPFWQMTAFARGNALIAGRLSLFGVRLDCPCFPTSSVAYRTLQRLGKRRFTPEHANMCVIYHILEVFNKGFCW